MVVYRELSSLEKDIGFSAKVLYMLSNRIHRHYKTVKIAKGDGTFRTLHVPDDLLKAVQTKIAQNLLSLEEISPYAKAYRLGGSTLKNAAPHVGKATVMKLDIRQFFDHCIYPVVKDKAFPAARYSEKNRVLLTLLCIYKDALPQGAPTSPAISNLILRDFDDTVGTWCRKQSIVYTRYCDDMTFSGSFDPQTVKVFVKDELRKLGFFLNDAKTVVLHNGQRKAVTGIVVNEKPNIPVGYRRKLRQKLYYCRKFGVEAHLKQIGSHIPKAQYIKTLLGRVNYVLSVRPDDDEFIRCRDWLQKQE